MMFIISCQICNTANAICNCVDSPGKDRPMTSKWLFEGILLIVMTLNREPGGGAMLTVTAVPCWFGFQPSLQEATTLLFCLEGYYTSTTLWLCLTSWQRYRHWIILTSCHFSGVSKTIWITNRCVPYCTYDLKWSILFLTCTHYS